MMKALSVVALVSGSIFTATGTSAEPLGRLFFSPAQRSILDAGKQVTKPVATVPAPRTVHLTGVVTRSDAESTIWINGTAYHDASPDGVQVKTDRAAPESTAILVPGKPARTRLKVGQQLDMNSGQIREGFSRQAAAAGSATAPTEKPSVAESKTKPSDIKPPVTGVKDENPATIAR